MLRLLEMTKSKFEGTGVALVTPFKASGEIDFEALKRILKYTADGGVDYYVVLGTTGEPATLEKEEKREILKFVIENNIKKLPIVFGLGGNNTAEIIKGLDDYDLSGVDALLSVSPYYNKPSQEGIYQHFMKIADSSPKPIIVYNVPGRTSSNMTAQTTIRLSYHANIIGLKEACSDMVQAMEVAKSKPAGFQLISGDDMLTLPMISFGGKGAISVAANAFPKLFTAGVNNALEGNFEEATSAHFKFLEINPLLYIESSPVGIKTCLEYLGLCSAEVRLPLVKCSAKLKGEIEGWIDKYKLS